MKILFNPKDLADTKTMKNDEEEKVVQRYIRRPLLVHGLKHDLRLYLLIASVDPLVAFLNEEGLARFCTDKYEIPTQQNKSKVSSAHLTNYSLNKNNPNFIHTDELTEVNKGTKQTLSSYWKALEAEGLDVDQIKADIKHLNQELLKALKPYLQYFEKCTFPGMEHGKYFHIIGVDIILDERCRPWVLEINASPSMNIDSTIQENPSTTATESESASNISRTIISNITMKLRKPPVPPSKPKFVTSPVDLHVKSMVLGHAVRLCKKPLSKIVDYEEYDSYTQIYSEETEEEIFADYNLLDNLYELFNELQGSRFQPALTPLKFSRLHKLFHGIGKKTIIRADIDAVFNKTMEYHEQMDLYAFMDAVELLLELAFTGDSDTSRKERLEIFCDKFMAMKKPLFYF